MVGSAHFLWGRQLANQQCELRSHGGMPVSDNAEPCFERVFRKPDDGVAKIGFLHRGADLGLLGICEGHHFVDLIENSIEWSRGMVDSIELVSYLSKL